MQGGRGEVKEISMSSQVIIFLDDAMKPWRCTRCFHASPPPPFNPHYDPIRQIGTKRPHFTDKETEDLGSESRLVCFPKPMTLTAS